MPGRLQRRPKCSRGHDDCTGCWCASDSGNACGGRPHRPRRAGCYSWAEYGGDAYLGVIYAFRPKRSDRIELVWCYSTGLLLMAKKLEPDGFKWPGVRDCGMRLASAQLGALPEGPDWRRGYGGRRPIASQRGFRRLIRHSHTHGTGPARSRGSAPCACARVVPQTGQRDGRKGRVRHGV